MGSAAEAEVGGLYLNALETSPMRTTLEELHHSQLATPMQIDNSRVNLGGVYSILYCIFLPYLGSVYFVGP